MFVKKKKKKKEGEETKKKKNEKNERWMKARSHGKYSTCNYTAISTEIVERL